MKVGDRSYRSIWRDADAREVEIIDQTLLPHDFVTCQLRTPDDALFAISDMKVRGAPLIGVTAAYGLSLALQDDPSDAGLASAAVALQATRPTAVNLRWALRRIADLVSKLDEGSRAQAAFNEADRMADEDARLCEAIGTNGVQLIEALHAPAQNRPVNILTHCNAGWLATVDWGTALAPIYKAHDRGIPVHVWVDETRPRNQGAALTAWELGAAGIDHSVIVDNAGGHLMQAGEVDLVITGADRVTATGHVCNKIGTYLKALAAHDTGVPFYVAFPASTIDWEIEDGSEIPIEERDAREVTHVGGATSEGIVEARILPEGSRARNYAFDVTPARLVTGFITEAGLSPASGAGLKTMFPDMGQQDE